MNIYRELAAVDGIINARQLFAHIFNMQNCPETEQQHKETAAAELFPAADLGAVIYPIFNGGARPLLAGHCQPSMAIFTISNGCHILVSGRTGSGKSVFLHNILSALLSAYSADDIAFILIDPKRVELVDYKNLAYCSGYSADNEKSLAYLRGVVELIADRYEYMQGRRLKTWQGTRLCVVIDEMADLMIDADYGAEFKRLLQKILQIGRASGVSVIACTQCPSRSVIPAPIVLNFTERIALKCNSAIESRQIINQKGAEELANHGEALWLGAEGLQKIQVPYIETEWFL